MCWLGTPVARWSRVRFTVLLASGVRRRQHTRARHIHCLLGQRTRQRKEAVVLARLVLVLMLTVASAANLDAQSWLAHRAAACRCDPTDKTRRPRFLLPIAGGIGFLPLIAARDSQVPTLGLPSLVDI